MSSKVVVVAGTRPNFMKVAPILAELRRFPEDFAPLLVHTGQHYDYRMSDIFFEELEMPAPDCYLGAQGEGATAQTADILLKFAPVLVRERPDLVLVVGDVTSTLACTLAAAQRDLPVAHVEAGLRSFDRRLPEELNRLAIDALADLLFTYSADADANLRAEKVPESCIFQVGNLMIDTLLRLRERAAASPILEDLGLEPGRYALVTLHRQSNVDDERTLAGILDALARIGQRLPLIFLVHPRTRKNAERFGLGPRLEHTPGLRLGEPAGYLDMLRLQGEARLVLTDSGGIQEETTVLQVPCLTLRESTERPVTIAQGSNTLVGCDPDRIVEAAFKVLDQEGQRAYPVPELWDGQAAGRLVAVLRQGIRRR
ncbi:MAG: UDP-N-acetylglucosamine 2-epimerase (non-hydrolyzing) [Candidatus Latescibacteria bacterium]|nr:UDP-N-acetylglucosamine 2-epimerase (non-hydrolyzing) [Candidatus Latescibacterota bacterium]